MKSSHKAIFSILLILHLGLPQTVQAATETPSAQQLPEELGVPAEEAASVLARIETSEPYRFAVYGKAMDLLSERNTAKKIQLIEFLVTGLRFEFKHRIIEELTGPRLHSRDFSEKARSEIVKAYKSINNSYLLLKLAGVLELAESEIDKIPRQQANTLSSIFGNVTEVKSYDRAYFISYEWGVLLYRARMADVEAAKSIIKKLEDTGERVLIETQVIRDLAYTQHPLLIQYLEGIVLHNKTPTEDHGDYLITAPAELAAEALNTWKDYQK